MSTSLDCDPLHEGTPSTVLSSNNFSAGRDIHLTFIGGTSAQSNASSFKLEWLSIVNYKPIQIDTYSRVIIGTGNWFLKSKVYTSWIGKKKGVLLGTGIPGVGKTFLCSIIIDDLRIRFRKKSNVGILFIYCRYNDQYSLSQILGALLRQLAENHPTICAHLDEHFYRRHATDKTKPSERDFARMTKECVSMLSRTFIIVDALDELQEKTRFALLESLDYLGVSALYTSRPLESLKNQLSSVLTFDIQPPEEDTRRLVFEGLKTIPALHSFLSKEPVLREEVISNIREKSAGMHLLARLQLESLGISGIYTVKKIRQALDNLPTDVDAMYDLTAERIRRQDPERRELAQRAIVWITLAFRSLSWEELSEAVIFSPKSAEVPTPDDRPDREAVLSCCQGLVVFDEENKTVRLIHYTAQEFFQRSPTVLQDDFTIGHHFIADICMNRLRQSSPLDLSTERATRAYCSGQTHPFEQAEGILLYAYDNWAAHAQACNGLEELQRDVEDFIFSWSPYPYLKTGASEHETRINIKPVHVAAAFGFLDILRSRRYECNLEILGDKFGFFAYTPLIIAIMEKQIDAVQLLLSFPEIKLISDRESFVDTTIFHYACEYSSLEIVKLLVSNHIAELDANSFREGPLITAIERGRDGDKEGEAIVKYLLQAYPDWDVGNYGFLLHTVCSMGCIEVVKLLLHRGADVNVCSHDVLPSPLITTIKGKSISNESSRELLLNLLLDHEDIDVNAAPGMEGWTALDYAYAKSTPRMMLRRVLQIYCVAPLASIPASSLPLGG